MSDEIAGDFLDEKASSESSDGSDSDPAVAGGETHESPPRAARSTTTGADFRIPLGFPGGGLPTSVSRLVERAATILEEELANGIVAAQHVGNRIVNLEGQREGADQQLLFRFRRDAHEIVDILMDVVGATAGRVSGMAERVVRIGGSPATSPTTIRNGGERLPVLEPQEAITVGQTAVIRMTIENDGREPTDTFALVCSSLVGETGHQLGIDVVSFEPPSLTLAAGESASVAITVRVPSDAARGVYSGIVQATRLDNVRAVLIVTID